MINIARSNKPVSIFIICLLRNVSFVRRHSLIDLVFRYFCACICLIQKREKNCIHAVTEKSQLKELSLRDI
ncbi:hypothetical protein NQ318_006058 [Aromia moschata]|uniref:Secreted protein n=1 Tax=Aromia moschata TaxID=1265417 RepID=A0AAV8Z495_9CUCU|nr:hypothetical protein NQ318_006058 [Aromia moschata]